VAFVTQYPQVLEWIYIQLKLLSKISCLIAIRLTEMLLVEFPSMRKDHRILKSYNFVMNFLEVFANETRNLITNNQKLLRGIIESAKISEIATEEHIKANVDKV